VFVIVVVLPAGSGGRSAINTSKVSVALAPALRSPTLNTTRLLTASNEPLPIDAVRFPRKSVPDGIGSVTTNQAERTPTGVSLRVTPQVNDNDYVTLFVEPAVISVAVSTFNSSFQDPQRRAARTTVMVKDGNTLVLGGLINTSETEVNRKVPVLGDIPLVGLAFRKKQVDRTDKEVIVFLTPHIIRISETPFPQEALESDQPVEVVVPSLEEREIVAPRTKEEEIEDILDQLSAQSD